MDRGGGEVIRKEDAVKVLRWILCATGMLVVGGEICAADQVTVEVSSIPKGESRAIRTSIAWTILAIRPR